MPQRRRHGLMRDRSPPRRLDYDENDYPARAPTYGVELSDMEGIDLFYNVTLHDKAKPQFSGKSYLLLEHPFQRVIPKPPQILKQIPAIIEIVIRATNTLIPTSLRPAQESWASDDENSGLQSDSQKDNANIIDSGTEGEESKSEKENPWQINKERFESHLEEYQLESYQVISMLIHSSHLQSLIRSVIVYYPAFNFKGNKMEFSFPFKPLMHYYHDLVALRMKGKSEKPMEEHLSENNMPPENMAQAQSKALDEDTLHALDVLLAYLEPIYSSTIQPEESRYREGLASWHLLWYLFKPGSDVYAMVGGKLAAFVVEEVIDAGQRPRTGVNVIIRCWSLAYKSRRVTKARTEFIIYSFTGEREISSLRAMPCSYVDAADKGKTRNILEALGAKYYEILKQVPTLRAYCGYAWGKRRKTIKSNKSEQRTYLNDGQIIVDPRGFLLPIEKTSGSGIDSSSDASSDQSTIEPDEAAEKEDSPSGFDKSPWAEVIIDPKSNSSLTKHQCFLLPRRIKGFDLRSKKWLYFDIEFISDINWSPEGDDPMSKLILGSTDIDILKALSRTHGNQAPSVWSADFIPGKGEGQIFLLHGPPGTGKTYTVGKLPLPILVFEPLLDVNPFLVADSFVVVISLLVVIISLSVADYTRRPLLSLTVADIGTDEQTMENNLHQWFEMAASWDAIILIDEADVFLEKRTVSDLQRNSLVSVFLRCMEYYTGMLFLTTNRIGHIDDAFLSRMSVALTYDTLDSTKQKLIWRGFLTKLRKERKDISLTGRAETYLENLHLNEDTKDIPWNGREIRNALQIAIALATHDAAEEAKESGEKVKKIRVEKDHFEKVIDRRKAFIKYRDSIRNKTEDQRAFVEGTRALPPKET